jgi:hypothetical protein
MKEVGCTLQARLTHPTWLAAKKLKEKRPGVDN